MIPEALHQVVAAEYLGALKVPVGPDDPGPVFGPPVLRGELRLGLTKHGRQHGRQVEGDCELSAVP